MEVVGGAAGGGDVDGEAVDLDDGRVAVFERGDQRGAAVGGVEVDLDGGGEGLGDVGLFLDDVPAAAADDVVDGDEVDVFVADRAQQPASGRGLERGRIVGGDLAAVADADAAQLAARELGRELRRDAPAHVGHGQVRPHRFERLGIDEGRVDGVGGRLALEHAGDVAGELDGDALLSLRSGSAEVRRRQHARVCDERVADGRLFGEDVERRAGDALLLKRGDQRRFVDQRAAGGVDQQRIGPHQGELLGAEQRRRAGRRRGVQADHLGTREQLVELDQLDAERAGAILGQERVVGDHGHIERLQSPRDGRADAAEADQSGDAADEFCADEGGALPAVGAQAGVGLDEVARSGEHERDGQLCGGDGVAAAGVEDGHAALGSGVEIDVVNTDAGASDRAELGRGRDQVGVHLRPAADDQRIGVGKPHLEFIARQTSGDIHFAGPAQDFQALVRNGFSDDDLVCHGAKAIPP